MELVIALILLVIVGYPVYRKLRRASQASTNGYSPINDSPLNSGEPWTGIVAFQGERAFHTETFSLEGGSWKLTYWFPEDVVVKVDLYSAPGDNHETLVMKRGTGAESFSAENGRYFCVIEPAREPAEWEIEISRLGLPSRQSSA